MFPASLFSTFTSMSSASCIYEVIATTPFVFLSFLIILNTDPKSLFCLKQKFLLYHRDGLLVGAGHPAVFDGLQLSWIHKDMHF